MEEALIGRTIAGKFVVESHIGDGAMGAVYKARQIALEKPVAIKVLHRELAVADGHLAARFHREALAASRLNHPSSIHILDFGEEPDGLLYIAMELAEGKNLHDVACDEAPLDPGRIVNLLSQVLAALAVAHEMGVIHRDLKPENIMVLDGVDDEGRPTDVVKVCDFGIATIAEPRSDRSPGAASFGTAAGAIVGTPEYMSPEQARGERLDPRSDLYSLGIVLFRLLTGELPFRAETALGVVLKQITGKPPRPSEIQPDVDPELEAICIRAMSKEPDERYASAREMRAALRSAVGPASRPLIRPAPISTRSASTPSTAPLAPTLEMPKPAAKAPPKRSRTLPGLLAFAAAGVLVLIGLLGSKDEATPAVDPSPAPSQVIASAPEAAEASAPAPSDEPPEIASAAPDSAPDEEPDKSPTQDTPSQGPAIAEAAPRADPQPAAQPPEASAEPVATPSAEPPPPSPSATPAAPQVATSLPAAATSAPTLAPPASTSPPKPFDPSRARVVLTSVSAAGGIPAAEARTALNHAAFTSCYRAALAALGRSAGGTAQLHLAIDETGRIRSASASGMSFLPSAKGCIESAARAIRVRNVDTGDATADATLSFVPE